MEDAGCSNFIMLTTIIVLAIVSVLFRVYYVIIRSHKSLYNLAQQPVRTLINLGSSELKPYIHYHHCTVVTCHDDIVAYDNMSLQKAHVLESSLVNQKDVEEVLKATKFMQIYRSREVGQSYLTSVGTTLIALAHALRIMIKIRPQVILCNGPGTCIPLCIIAFLFKVVGIR